MSNRPYALERALEFHRRAESDDPATVIETAKTFEGYLNEGSESTYQPKHAAPVGA